MLWLTRFPKHVAGQELRELILLLLKIKTDNDKTFWIKEFNDWYKRHKPYLNEKTFIQLQADTGTHISCSGALT